MGSVVGWTFFTLGSLSASVAMMTVIVMVLEGLKTSIMRSFGKSDQKPTFQRQTTWIVVGATATINLCCLGYAFTAALIGL